VSIEKVIDTLTCNKPLKKSHGSTLDGESGGGQDHGMVAQIAAE
jgi:hypothetical protein